MLYTGRQQSPSSQCMHALRQDGREQGQYAGHANSHILIIRFSSHAMPRNMNRMHKSLHDTENKCHTWGIISQLHPCMAANVQCQGMLHSLSPFRYAVTLAMATIHGGVKLARHSSSYSARIRTVSVSLRCTFTSTARAKLSVHLHTCKGVM